MNQYNELFTALSKAQAEMQTAGMNSANPFFKSKYADFAEIVRASRPALTKNGLCVIQKVDNTPEGMVLSTILGHSSGQSIESNMRISPPKADAQSLGGYITYLKRYAYAAIVGVVISDDPMDDDAESISYANRNSYVKKEEFLSDDQINHLRNKLGSRPNLAEELFEKATSKYRTNDPDYPVVTRLDQIKKVDYESTIKFIDKRATN